MTEESFYNDDLTELYESIKSNYPQYILDTVHSSLIFYYNLTGIMPDEDELDGVIYNLYSMLTKEENDRRYKEALKNSGLSEDDFDKFTEERLLSKNDY